MMKWKDALVVLLFGFLFYLILDNTHLDSPKEELRILYTNEESEFISLLSHNFQVHYRDEGDKESPILVLLHGTGSSLHTWDGWTQYLRKDFRIIRMDLPGFGLTGPPLSPDETYTYSLFNYTSFLKGFLDHLGLGNKKIFIGGNSLGGAISWLFAGQYPEKVEKLILVDALGILSVDHNLDNITVPLAMIVSRLPIVSEVMKYLTPRFLVEKSMLEVFHDDSKVTPEVVDRYFDLLLHEGNREAFVLRSKLGMVEDDKNSAVYLDLRKFYRGPTLIQWGKEDLWLGVDAGYKLREVFENSRLIVYEGAGHIPQEEIPEETARDADAFLRAT